MNQLMNFNFNDNDMTVIKNGDQIWFRGFTVASIMIQKAARCNKRPCER